MGQNPWYLGTNSKIHGKWMFNCSENGPRSIDPFPNLLVAFNPFKEREREKTPLGTHLAHRGAACTLRWRPQGSGGDHRQIPKKTRFIWKNALKQWKYKLGKHLLKFYMVHPCKRQRDWRIVSRKSRDLASSKCMAGDCRWSDWFHPMAMPLCPTSGPSNGHQSPPSGPSSGGSRFIRGGPWGRTATRMATVKSRLI